MQKAVWLLARLKNALAAGQTAGLHGMSASGKQRDAAGAQHALCGWADNVSADVERSYQGCTFELLVLCKLLDLLIRVGLLHQELQAAVFEAMLSRAPRSCGENLCPPCYAQVESGRLLCH